MVTISIVLALCIAIVLPILSAKGKGWRGLWFGLSIPTLIVAIYFGSRPVLTLEQTRTAAEDQSISEEQYELMKNMDPAALALAMGVCLGCLISGCVYRKPSTLGCRQ